MLCYAKHTAKWLRTGGVLCLWRCTTRLLCMRDGEGAVVTPPRTLQPYSLVTMTASMPKLVASLAIVAA